MGYTGTTNYGFQKPEKNNSFNVDDLNNALDKIDETIKGELESNSISGLDASISDSILNIKIIKGDGTELTDSVSLAMNEPTEITESQPFTVIDAGVYEIVAIGGKGGDGGNGGRGWTEENGSGWIYRAGGGGKGGKGAMGYITTINIELNAGDEITVVRGGIGENGTNGANGTTDDRGGDYNGHNGTSGKNGGNTVVSRNGNVILTAQGGEGGTYGRGGGGTSGITDQGDGGDGGRGGSGSIGGDGGTGGSAGFFSTGSSDSEYNGNPGSDARGGTTYSPNRNNFYSSDGRIAVTMWDTPAEIFGESFNRVAELMNYDGNGRAFIMKSIEAIYPL